MNKFLFELGNSRVKIACVNQDHQYLYLGRFDYDALSAVLDAFQEAGITLIGESFIASVASHERNHRLIEWIKENLDSPTEFIKIKPQFNGIEFKYQNINQLGIDRWLAVIGASDHTHRHFIIIDCGTATNIEVVTDNIYKGGYISPGLKLMRDSLVKGTGLLESYDFNGEHDGQFVPDNSADAVYFGTKYSLAAYVNQMVKVIQAAYPFQFEVIATGGDFLQISPLLKSEISYQEDLTLKGLLKVIQN